VTADGPQFLIIEAACCAFSSCTPQYYRHVGSRHDRVKLDLTAQSQGSELVINLLFSIQFIILNPTSTSENGSNSRPQCSLLQYPTDHIQGIQDQGDIRDHWWPEDLYASKRFFCIWLRLIHSNDAFKYFVLTLVDVTGPASAKNAILVVYDIFGYFPQTLQGADILATSDEKHSYQVFMPDFFEGEPADIAWYFYPDSSCLKTLVTEISKVSPGDRRTKDCSFLLVPFPDASNRRRQNSQNPSRYRSHVRKEDMGCSRSKLMSCPVKISPTDHALVLLGRKSRCFDIWT